MMKRFIAMLLMLMLCPLAIAETTEDDEPMEPIYTFDLTVNGKHEVTVQPGDIITVVFTVIRTDEDEDAQYTLYSMQDELVYDDTFVQPMENGCITQAEVMTTDLALRGNGRAFYMNYLSFADGTLWNDTQLVGTFQLQINGESGITELNNENFFVTKEGGQLLYETNCNDLLIYVSDECTVRFDTDGGSEMEDVTVTYGELLEQPADPVKEGMHLRGWFKDYDLTEPWDFTTEPVSRNMVLYAGWDEGEPEAQDEVETVEPKESEVPTENKVRLTFDSNGGKPVEDIWVVQGELVGELPTPVRAGYRFVGWYKDIRHTQAWDADSDVCTDKRTKLYAAWEKLS